MIERIMDISKPWKGHVFLTDNGGEFMPQGESIILDQGLMHITHLIHLFMGRYPSMALTSSCQGTVGLHAQDDDAEWKQLFQLASCISTVPIESTKRAWDCNFFLGNEKSLLGVDDMLWGRGKASNDEREKRHLGCTNAYKEFFNKGSCYW
jgi:hypothetical protein